MNARIFVFLALAGTTAGCSSDPDPATPASSPDGGTPGAEAGAAPLDGGSSPATPATLAAGQAVLQLTFSNRATANVIGDAFANDAKNSTVKLTDIKDETTAKIAGYPVGTLTTVGGSRGTSGAQITFFVGEVKAGATYELTAEGGGINAKPGYRADFVQVIDSGSALWSTTSVSPPAGKVTFLTVTGKRFTFKVEGVQMGPATNGNVSGKGTFTVDGTGEGELP